MGRGVNYTGSSLSQARHNTRLTKSHKPPIRGRPLFPLSPPHPSHDHTASAETDDSDQEQAHADISIKVRKAVNDISAQYTVRCPELLYLSQLRASQRNGLNDEDQARYLELQAEVNERMGKDRADWEGRKRARARQEDVGCDDAPTWNPEVNVDILPPRVGSGPASKKPLSAKERRRKLDALVARGNFAELSPPRNIAPPYRTARPGFAPPNDAGNEDYDYDAEGQFDYRMPMSSELPGQQEYRSNTSEDLDLLGSADAQVVIELYNTPHFSTAVERSRPGSAGQQEDKSTITACPQPRNETEPLYTALPTHPAYTHAEHPLGAAQHTDSLIEAHSDDDDLQQVDQARVSVSPARSLAPTQRSILLSPSSSLEHVDAGDQYTHYERAYKRSRLAADTAWEQEVRERAGGSMSPWVWVGSAMTCQAKTLTPAPAQVVSFDGALGYEYQDEDDVELKRGEGSCERSDGVDGAACEAYDWPRGHYFWKRQEREEEDEEVEEQAEGVHQYGCPSRAVNYRSSSLTRRLPQGTDTASIPIPLQAADHYYFQQESPAPVHSTPLPSPFLQRSSLMRS